MKLLRARNVQWDKMKNSKFTARSSRAIRYTEHHITSAARHWRLKLRAYVALSFWLLFAVCLPSAAQHSIGWHKFTGGGGTSTNGQYTVAGTIGQHDAGITMTNSQFSVMGGLWALPQAVQVEGAPTLSLARVAPGHTTISWSPNTPGFVLQETWSLSLTNWTNSPTGSTNPVTFPTLGGAKFFRLRKL
jgi:hypothetical protein